MHTYNINYTAAWVQRVTRGFNVEIKANSRDEAIAEFEKYYPHARIISVKKKR